MVLASPREHQLVRDTLVEAAYMVDGLSDAECAARLGRTKSELQKIINSWREFRSHRDLSVADLEVIRSCFQETLDFFSGAEYEMRTGWTREESSQLFRSFMQDRKQITIDRQWGQSSDSPDGM